MGRTWTERACKHAVKAGNSISGPIRVSAASRNQNLTTDLQARKHRDKIAAWLQQLSGVRNSVADS